MKVTEASCVINALKVTEIAIKNFPETGITMDSVYALGVADPKTKRILSTHGRCTAITANWSKETMEKLAELIDSMEQDLLPRHFSGVASDKEIEDAKRPEARGHQEVDQI